MRAMDRDKKSMSKSISIWVNFMLNARRFCYICLSTPPFCKIPTHHTFLTIYCWVSAPFNHFSHFRLCTMTSFLSRHIYCSHWWCVKNSSRPGWPCALFSAGSLSAVEIGIRRSVNSFGATASLLTRDCFPACFPRKFYSKLRSGRDMLATNGSAIPIERRALFDLMQQVQLPDDETDLSLRCLGRCGSWLLGGWRHCYTWLTETVDLVWFV